MPLRTAPWGGDEDGRGVRARSRYAASVRWASPGAAVLLALAACNKPARPPAGAEDASVHPAAVTGRPAAGDAGHAPAGDDLPAEVRALGPDAVDAYLAVLAAPSVPPIDPSQRVIAYSREPIVDGGAGAEVIFEVHADGVLRPVLPKRAAIVSLYLRAFALGNENPPEAAALYKVVRIQTDKSDVFHVRAVKHLQELMGADAGITPEELAEVAREDRQEHRERAERLARDQRDAEQAFERAQDLADTDPIQALDEVHHCLDLASLDTQLHRDAEALLTTLRKPRR
jgi:hypothetical protein